MHYTYMVECRDGSLYTGYTTNLDRRVKTHNSGNGAKYTRTRLPVRLMYYEIYESKAQAMKREYEIKHLTKENKLKLIQEFQLYTKEEKIVHRVPEEEK